MTPFGFASAGALRFGRGVASEAVKNALGYGNRVLLVRGRAVAFADRLAADLASAGAVVTQVTGQGEPDLPGVEAAVAAGREAAADVVVAIGGGAVLDLGKAVAALVPATRPVTDHLEVVGQGLPLDHPPLPVIALPTTAGTGAEVTRNAVIAVPEARRKVSLRDPAMLPRLALVDPALTDGCPWSVTLASGLDALTQVIEPFLSSRANPMTDALCRDAIPRGAAALVRLGDGEDAQARDDMALTSLFGGLALANAGLGAVHGLAGPIGGLSGAPHGAVCGTLLPHVFAANRAAGADRTRCDQIEAWLRRAGFDGMDGLAHWSKKAGLPGLSALGLSAADRDASAEMAAGSSSMKANPVLLSADTLRWVLAAAA